MITLDLPYSLTKCVCVYDWGSKWVRTYKGKNEYYYVPSGSSLTPIPPGIFNKIFTEDDGPF